MRTGSVSCSGAGGMAETSPVSKYFTCAAKIVDLIFLYPTLCIFLCGLYPSEGIVLNPFRGTACTA